MSKKNPPNEDLAAAISELGGNDEDLKLLENADFSGSDYEDEEVKPAKNTAELADDVAKMWEELSGGSKKETNGSKNITEKKDNSRKKTSKESIEKNVSNSSQENAPKSKKEEALKEKAMKEKNPKENLKHNGDKKQLAKPIIENKPKLAAALPTAPKPLSKKQTQAWDKYITTLEHPKSGLLIEDGQNWYSIGSSESNTDNNDILDRGLVEKVKSKAQELLDIDNQIYYKQRLADREFTSSLDFLKMGTFSDQLGTLSILSTDSPLHSKKFLTDLESKCEVKHRESACKALEVTKDLLVSHVLPDRRLRWFKDQPLKIGVSMPTLVAWCFEDFLKQYFFHLLQVMERLLSDTVENIRTRTLHCVFSFFQEKPEQEANLLRLGLNKLGDPAGKVASRVKKLLMDALQRHPGMKPIVATAMAELLGRTNDYRTRYYSVDTLSEFILSNRDAGLANQLIYIYLNLFERLLAETKEANDSRVEKAPASKGKPKSGSRFRQKRGKKGGIRQEHPDSNEMESQQHARLVAKIFTGLNRAFPFSNLSPEVFSKYVDTLYHMSHSTNVGTFIEALSFIFQLSKASSKNVDDRYYRALYDSLLDSRLTHSSKFSKYIYLLLRSMAELKAESETARSSAFIKRSLQVACNLSEVGTAASLIHVASMTPHVSHVVEDTQEKDADEYNPKQRDPRFAKAESSKAWEVVLLQQHFHPTVALYAKNLVAEEAEKVHLDVPDIEQYTVNSFLSKWSYKKPKAKESTRGGSIFQPLSGFTDLTLGIRQQKKSSDIPASMQDWRNKNVRDVAPEERFLYEYFSKMPEKKSKNTTDETGDNDINDDSDNDSIAEDDINEAMSRSGPGDLGGADIHMSDMDDDSEDGDLEADLETAFADDDSEDDDDDANADNFEGPGELSGSDDDADDDADIPEDLGDEEFADFGDGEAGLEVQSEEDTGENKKRKRGRINYPTFLDADAFEEMYAKEEKPKKRR